MTAAASPQAGPSDIDPFKIARWDLVPGRTALVVIDPQNDFLHHDGWYAKSGVDITHMQRTIEPTRTLVSAARAKGIPVIWTRHGFRDGRDAGVFFELRPFLKDGGLRQGTWGGAILDDLGAVPEDWYIEKTRLSAFYNTSLDTTLRAVISLPRSRPRLRTSGDSSATNVSSGQRLGCAASAWRHHHSSPLKRRGGVARRFWPGAARRGAPLQPSSPPRSGGPRFGRTAASP